MKWDEFYRNNQAKIIIIDFSPEHTEQIKKELGIAYDKSPLLREMIDNWVIRDKKSFSISHWQGMPQGKYETDPVTGAPVGRGLGEVRLSVEYCEASLYITDSGQAVKHTLTSVLVHELGHALTGRADDGVGMDMHQFNNDDHDYKGSNVKYVNDIFEELKLPKLNSYIAQNLPANRYTGLFDPDNIFLIENHQYTDGAIEHSVVKKFWC